MRASSAPIVPAGQEFVRIDVAPRAQAPDGPAPAAPAPAITVSIGAAVVSVPAGATVADVACVLGAVSRL